MASYIELYYKLSMLILYIRAGGNSPAAPVLARPLKVKMKVHFTNSK